MNEIPTIPSNATAVTFTVPEKDRQPGDPTKITIRTRYSIGTELDAVKSAGAFGNTNYEILRRIIVRVDGKQVDQGLDFMENWSPKARVYAVDALNHLSMPEAADRKAFLQSAEVEIG